MKYFFALFFLLSAQFAHAQMGLLLGGTRIAVSAATLAARQKKAGRQHAVPVSKDAAGVTAATAAPITGRGVTPFTYHGQSIPVKRTVLETLKGKGGPEIQALEAKLEESRKALLADSVQFFLPVTQREAIVEAARTAAAARPDWNYAPYRQELAFYEKEEARRQQAAQPAPASTK